PPTTDAACNSKRYPALSRPEPGVPCADAAASAMPAAPMRPAKTSNAVSMANLVMRYSKEFQRNTRICDAVFRSFAPCQVLTDYSPNEHRLGFYARDRNEPITAQSIPNCSSGPGVAHSAGALFLSSTPFLLEPRDGRAQFRDSGSF